MNKPIKAAPAENKEIDFLNPVEVAGAGFRKSVEVLRTILGRKSENLNALKPATKRDQEIVTVIKKSVNDRNRLAHEVTVAA